MNIFLINFLHIKHGSWILDCCDKRELTDECGCWNWLAIFGLKSDCCRKRSCCSTCKRGWLSNERCSCCKPSAWVRPTVDCIHGKSGKFLINGL